MKGNLIVRIAILRILVLYRLFIYFLLGPVGFRGGTSNSSISTYPDQKPVQEQLKNNQ